MAENVPRRPVKGWFRLGGHHHYHNCAEGLPSVASEREGTPCTVMHNLVDLQSLIFSKLEGAVVCGHAAAFAD